MSFFDNYKDLGGGGKYLSAAEKQFLIENGVAFTIEKLAMDEDNSFGPRWVAFVQVPSQTEKGVTEARKISFPVGSGAESRDSMLKQMDKYLQSEGAEPVTVKLNKPGRAIFIESA